jgi:hypothetical protein
MGSAIATNGRRSSTTREFRCGHAFGHNEGTAGAAGQSSVRAAKIIFSEMELFPLHADVVAQLGTGVGLGPKRELLARLSAQDSVLHAPRDRGVGGCVASAWPVRAATVDSSRDARQGFSIEDLEVRGVGCRMEIDDQTVRRNQRERVSQGMDHALSGHSSQRPREESDIEPAAVWLKGIDADSKEFGVVRPPLTAPNSRDDVLIGIDRNHGASDVRVGCGQPAVTAPDFKDARTVECHAKGPQRVRLTMVLIDAYAHAVPEIIRTVYCLLASFVSSWRALLHVAPEPQCGARCPPATRAFRLA